MAATAPFSPGAYIPGEETDFDGIVKASRARSGEVAAPTLPSSSRSTPPSRRRPTFSSGIDAGRRSTATEFEVSVPDGEPPVTYASWVSVGYGVATGTSAVFEPRTPEPDYVFESFEDDLVTSGWALADVTVPHSEGRTIYHQEMRTPAVKLFRPSGDSPRPGCARRLALVDGTVVAVAGLRCDRWRLRHCRCRPPLVPPYTPDTPQPADVEEATVQLEAATTVGSVSVRGCDEGCTAQLSLDGSTWTDPSEVAGRRCSPTAWDESILIATFEPAGQRRFVRVSLPGGTLSATQASAGRPRPARPAAHPGGVARRFPHPRRHRPPPGSRTRPCLWVRRWSRSPSSGRSPPPSGG